MTTRRVLTVEEMFNKSMNTYPSIYIGETLELTKLAFLDHVLNTSGSGYSSFKSFTTTLEVGDPLFNPPPSYYYSGKPLFYIIPPKDNGASGVAHNSLDETLYTEDMSKSFLACGMRARETTKQTYFKPYPNFRKTSSIIWSMHASNKPIPECFGLDWAEAAYFFYSKSKEFFQSDLECEYSSAWAKLPPERSMRTLENIKNQLTSNFGDLSTPESLEKVNKYYEDGGDGELIKKFPITVDFETSYLAHSLARWEVEKKTVLSFIDETLQLLESQILLAKSQAQTPRPTPV